MTRRFIRFLAILLVTGYAFAQASAALAGCAMEQGSSMQDMTMPSGEGCDGCAKVNWDSLAPSCVMHCTADAQLAAPEPVAIAASTLVMTLPKAPPRARHSRSPDRPPGTLPRRILLHSFQV
jgi:hypothetical protein